MERKVWSTTSIGDLYPNTYTVLVGPPGVGKTVLTAIARKMWAELPGQHIASSNVSPQSLLDDLRDAERQEIKPSGVVAFNSLKVASDELGVLLPEWDSTFMNILQALYDCEPISERKRTHELKYLIESPQLHMLAACTPNFLKNLMPEGAWDQGFASRTFFIYSGEVVIQDIFEVAAAVDLREFEALIADLQVIAGLFGRAVFSVDAVTAIKAWHMSGGKPKPDHPKLSHYITRRTAHLIKLCLVACASRGNDLQITLDDYQLALSWLLDAEVYMGDIFKAMASGGDSSVIKDTYHFAFQVYVKKKEPIPEHKLIMFLQERVPAHSVGPILNNMVRARIFTETQVPKVGKCYIPRSPGEA